MIEGLDKLALDRILSACDHTLLLQDAGFEDIKVILEDAMKYKTASACIPACYVKAAKEYVGDALKICTVIFLLAADAGALRRQRAAAGDDRLCRLRCLRRPAVYPPRPVPAQGGAV